MSPALLRYDGMRWKLNPQPVNDELLAGAVRRGDQVMLALELELHVSSGEFAQQGGRLASDFDRGFQVGTQTSARLNFVEILDVVFVKEQIGLALARQTDEVDVIEFDHARDFGVVCQPDPHGN